MKLKSLCLVLFMLCMSTVVFAQEKYEQAVVMQYVTGTLKPILAISIEGKSYTKSNISKDDISDLYTDLSPLLKQVAAMRNDGWEVWNSTSFTNGVSYFLRRKLK